MTQFDSDCDGKMSFVEFQKAVEKLKELEAAVSWSFANIFDETEYILFCFPNFGMLEEITLWNVKKIEKKLKYWKLQFRQAVATRKEADRVLVKPAMVEKSGCYSPTMSLRDNITIRVPPQFLDKGFE